MNVLHDSPAPSESVVVVQARTSSSRLPAKVLLPIDGLPVVVLAAKRAGNTGRRVIVATSDDPSDDALAAVLESQGIENFRGSLHDPLQRFLALLRRFDDEALVFRLTADNVLPDGRLLDAMERDFAERRVEYLLCNGPRSGVPYGVSAELMRVRALRDAHDNSTSAFDRAHVTPYVARKHGGRCFAPQREPGWGRLRSTIDTFDDYVDVLRAFEGVQDPVEVPWQDLVPRLEGASRYRLAETAPASRLVLGTAQLGMRYGIANDAQQPSVECAETIIRTAISNGVAYLDTARAYGTSEDNIGHALQGGWHSRVTVVTKLDPLEHCPAAANRNVVNAFVDASVYRSCTALGVKNLDVLLLHRASHLTDWEGAAMKRLLELKLDGAVRRVGVSVQNPSELDKALDSSAIDWIQLPVNVLDDRWEGVGTKLQRAREHAAINVHARGVLLQGLLRSKDPNHWRIANEPHYERVTSWLEAQRRSCGCESVVELALRYVTAIDWIDGVVVGVETVEQLMENVRMIQLPPLTKSQMRDIADSRPRVAAATLDPSCWQRR